MTSSSTRPPSGPSHPRVDPATTVVPTTDRRGFLSLGAGAALSALTIGCSGRRHPAGPTGGAAVPVGSGATRTVVIGCIAPFSGPRSYLGDIAAAGLDAALGHIQSDLGGEIDGVRPQVVRADAPLSVADGQKAYAQLIARGVDAIVWCGAPGLVETLPAIVHDVIAVMAVGSDVQGRAGGDPHVPDLTTAAAAGFPVFQTTAPDTWAFDLLCQYARSDRGFDNAALVYGPSQWAGVADQFATACEAAGLHNAATLGFGVFGGPDLGSVVAQLRTSRAQAVLVWALPDEAADVAAALDAGGARYVDTPAARAGFRPMLLGGAAGVGHPAFAALGQPHVAPGSIGVGHLGGVLALPDLAIRQWVGRFVGRGAAASGGAGTTGSGGAAPGPATSAPTTTPGGTGRPTTTAGGPAALLRGGEAAVADAVAACCVAAARVASTARVDLIAALESGVETVFATPVATSFAADRHLSLGRDELVLVSTETVAERRYFLGREWSLAPPGFGGPDLLVDPTLDANRRAHPEVVDAILGARTGTSSRPEYQNSDAARSAACRAVH